MAQLFPIPAAPTTIVLGGSACNNSADNGVQSIAISEMVRGYIGSVSAQSITRSIGGNPLAYP